MRTTITLDDDVASRLETEARRSGQSFKTVVNEFLRSGLMQRQTAGKAPRFVVAPLDLGGALPGRSYDDIGALLEEAEGPRHR